MQPKKKPTPVTDREPLDLSREIDSQRIGEQQFNELIEISSDFYFETDEHHRFTVLRGPTVDKWKFDAGSLLGKTRWELPYTYPVSDRGSWEKYKARLHAREPIVDFIYKYVNANGELKYTATSGRPIYDAQGHFKGYRGLGRDVTERMRMEHRLAIEREVARILTEAPAWTEATRRIVERISVTLGAACGAHWTVDEETRSLRCVDTWGGSAPGIAEFLSASKSESVIAGADDGLVRRTHLRGEPQWIKNVGKDPSYRRAAPAATAGVRSALAFPINAAGKIIGVMEFYWRETPHHADPELLRSVAQLGQSVGQFYDRKAAEEELHRFRAVMDASPDLIFFVDPEKMRFIYVNEANMRTTGYTREDYKWITPAKASGTDPATIKQLYEKVIAMQGDVYTTEVMYRSREGRGGWFETSRRAVRVGDKWVVASISRETTSRKLTEKKAASLSRMYAALSATNEAIMHSESSAELYRRACDAAVQGGEFLRAALLLVEPDRKRLAIVAAGGLGAERLHDIPLEETQPEAQGLVGTAFRSGSPCVSNDFMKDERMRPWHADAEQSGIRAGAAVPLLRHGRAIGVLLLHSNERRAFDDKVVKLLERMAENIVFALDNFEHEAERRRAEERVQYLASHDSLTALPNRVMFNDMLHTAIQSAKRYAEKFALLFIDLDRFKVINDTLGHEAGDLLLQETSRRLREALRTSDNVARLGGDEFVVLVRDISDADQAAAVARKVLSAVTRPIILVGQECRVTASVGIAMYPGDGENQQALMKHADVAMYLAKEQGKNNFQFHSRTDHAGKQ